nr:MAG TPA: hypothetical protein [Caudoviricetes sp.]
MTCFILLIKQAITSVNNRTEVLFMKCKKCKKTLQSDFKFCPWCGSKAVNQKYYSRVY